MSYEYIQKPCLNVQRSLELWGRWSRLFARSLETREQQDILVSEKDPRFWEMWTVTRMEEQFREEVESCVQTLRKEYPNDKRPIKELRKLLAKALLAEGWKPNLSLIKREISALKKERKEEIRWLKETVRRRQ